MKRNSALVMVSAIAAALQVAVAGDISGTITLKGTPPAEKDIDRSADPHCGAAGGKATTHHYVRGANGELANVVVSLKGISPQSKGESAPPVVLDQKGCEYAPVVSAVQTGQKIMIKNSDPTTHNVHTVPLAGNKEINQAQAERAPDLTYTPAKPENFLTFKCEVHPWMFAWVSVFDHPYFAVSDKDGKYTIKDVPDGKYTVQAMHRKAAPAASPVTQEIEVKGGNVIANFTLEAK